MDQGFPQELQKKFYNVLGVISKQTYKNAYLGIGNEYETYILLDGSTVTFPTRIYFKDDEKAYDTLEDRDERLIYDCFLPEAVTAM